MGVASGCGWQEVGVASGSKWNLWVWLLGVVVKEVYRFLHITYPYVLLLYLLFFCSSILPFVHSKKSFLFLFQYNFVIYLIIFSRSINKHKGDYRRPTEAI